MPAWVNNPITLVIALLAVVTVIFKVARLPCLGVDDSDAPHSAFE